jgi:hypothetical protein
MIKRAAQCSEGVKGVQIALASLFVALWCYGLRRFALYDHLNGVNHVRVSNSGTVSGRAVVVPRNEIAPPVSRQGDSSNALMTEVVLASDEAR